VTSFHWNPSTEYTEIYRVTQNRCRQTDGGQDGQPQNTKPPPPTVSEGIIMTMGKNPGVATKHNDRLQRRTVYTIFPGDTPEVQI